MYKIIKPGLKNVIIQEEIVNYIVGILNFKRLFEARKKVIICLIKKFITSDDTYNHLYLTYKSENNA